LSKLRRAVEDASTEYAVADSKKMHLNARLQQDDDEVQALKDKVRLSPFVLLFPQFLKLSALSPYNLFPQFLKLSALSPYNLFPQPFLKLSALSPFNFPATRPPKSSKCSPLVPYQARRSWRRWREKPRRNWSRRRHRSRSSRAVNAQWWRGALGRGCNISNAFSVLKPWRRLRHLEDERLQLMRKATNFQSKAVRYKMLAAKVCALEHNQLLFFLFHYTPSLR
jgi:hypothetical protein